MKTPGERIELARMIIQTDDGKTTVFRETISELHFAHQEGIDRLEKAVREANRKMKPKPKHKLREVSKLGPHD